MSLEVPVFPLHTVLFPDGELPLRIFELRYRRLVDECGKNRPFVIVRIREGAEVGEAAFTFDVGTLVHFSELVSQRDGSLGALVLAEERVRLHDRRIDADGLMFARAEPLPQDDYVPIPSDLQALATELESQGDVIPDAGMLTWRVAERLPLDLDHRQELLEETRVGHRMEMIRAWLLRHPGWFSA